MEQKSILTIFLFALAINVALACNGFKAKVVKIENCAGPDSVITVDPQFSVNLNDQCELVPTGCITNKAFNTAVSTYKIQKDNMMVKEGKIDLCAIAESATQEAKDILKVFGAPERCPVPAEKICANNHKVDLSKYKAMLTMAKGNIIVDSKIEHDTGKSCIHAEIEISSSFMR